MLFMQDYYPYNLLKALRLCVYIQVQNGYSMITNIVNNTKTKWAIHSCHKLLIFSLMMEIQMYFHMSPVIAWHRQYDISTLGYIYYG